MLNQRNCGGRTIARTIGNVNICCSGIVLKTITIIVAIVSNPEFLLFKVECLIGFGQAITPRNHEIFKPAFKSGYPTSGE